MKVHVYRTKKGNWKARCNDENGCRWKGKVGPRESAILCWDAHLHVLAHDPEVWELYQEIKRAKGLTSQRRSIVAVEAMGKIKWLRSETTEFEPRRLRWLDRCREAVLVDLMGMDPRHLLPVEPAPDPNPGLTAFVTGRRLD